MMSEPRPDLHAEIMRLQAQLREKDSMLDALGKECDKLEEDREYNAGLVRERERELAETQAWVRDQLAMCGDREMELEQEVERLRDIEERAERELYVAGCVDDGISPTMRLLWRILGRDKALLTRRPAP